MVRRGGTIITKLNVQRWWLGPAIAAVVSVSVTIIMVAWEWLENPGGIFRDANGTNWGFLYDTAISWLFPTFGYVTATAVSVQLIWLGVGWYRRRKIKLPDDE
jgi:hypothetical protein